MVKRELSRRLDWLIKLRWIAACVVFLVVGGCYFVLKPVLPFTFLYLGGAVLFLCNLLFSFYNRKLDLTIESKDWQKRADRFANVQISTDLIMLAYLLHFAGGLENPFIFFFIFHMVIASTLLSNRAAYLQATLAAGLFGMVILNEHLQLLPHYHLQNFISEERILNRSYFLGTYGILVVTLYLTVYMATNIVNKLRARETELAVANEKLAQQDRLKSQYVLMVSHDLQSSLATIQNCLKVVSTGLTGQLPEKAREMVARAEQRTVYLLHFVKDLLDLSRIKAVRELEKAEFSLRELLFKVAEQLRPRAEEKRISLELKCPQGPCLLYANQDAIEELLMNLAINGIKYTPWGGKVGIETKEVEGMESCLHTRVWDTGIGIPAEELPRIFDEFYRCKNAEAMEKEGTGLGLSIVKEILRAHQGEIWVESEIGKGTSFFLR